MLLEVAGTLNLGSKIGAKQRKEGRSEDYSWCGEGMQLVPKAQT
jgi:hypothetical protein